MNILITGLITGSMLALLAISFSLIFGVARIVNIAHTAFYMVAAYCIFSLTGKFGLNPVAGMMVAVVVVTVLGLLAYKFLIDPIREHEAAVLIATIALAMIFQEAILLIYTGDYRTVSALIEGYFIVTGVKVFYQQVLTFGVVLVILGILWVLLMKTKLGLAIRSTAEDREVANLMGMNDSRLDHDGHLRCACRLHRGGDRATDRSEPLHVDGTIDLDDGRCRPGGLGQHQGKFRRGLYPGVYRGLGGFFGPHRGLLKRIRRPFDHDPGPADKAGRSFWYLL
jgi:hypothetical protein